MPTPWGRRSFVPVLLSAVLLVSGCGGGSSSEGDPATSTPTGSPTPTPTPTPTSGPPKMYTYGNGIPVAAKADLAKLTGASASFRAFLLREIARQEREFSATGSCSPISLVVYRFRTNGWAEASVESANCPGGYHAWYGEKGGWREVYGGQSVDDCSTLEPLRIPEPFLESCLRNDQIVPYEGPA